MEFLSVEEIMKEVITMIKEIEPVKKNEILNRMTHWWFSEKSMSYENIVKAISEIKKQELVEEEYEGYFVTTEKGRNLLKKE